MHHARRDTGLRLIAGLGVAVMSAQVIRNSPASPVRRWLGLGCCLLLCFAAAAMGGLFMPGEWYASLRKPSWNPPGWIFGPVWTALYSMMAVAAWLVWQRGGFVAQRRSLGLFLVQLALNAAWTPLFFGLHRPGLAFAEIVCLWLAIAATLAVFHPASRAAAWLLAPYLAWVSFATALNFALWRLNAEPAASTFAPRPVLSVRARADQVSHDDCHGHVAPAAHRATGPARGTLPVQRR